MKIAFVSQPIDTILPPNQNSVGTCTLGAARKMARYADILVYALKDNHVNSPAPVVENGINFRFLPSTRRDRMLFDARNKFSKLFHRCTPISTSSWLFPDYGRQVAFDLQHQGCDVIHLQHCSQYAPIIRALNPKAKIVLHLRTEWFSQTDPAILTARLKAVDLLTTVGDHVTEKTRRAFPTVAHRCATTYNGVDVQEFPSDADYSAGRKCKVKRVLYCGAVSPHKGLHVLFEAFALVAREYPDVHLDIVGPLGNYPIEETFDLKDGETIKMVAPFYATSYWSLMKSMLNHSGSRESAYLTYLETNLPLDVAGKISVWGTIPRQELLDRYYSSDVFAFAPIWDEGFGLPPVEAMAAGLPVVASRSGTVEETVVHGLTGFLVEKNNVGELAQALLLLLKDDARREAMGRAGRRRVLKHFTWSRVAAGMYTRYEQLCDRETSQRLKVLNTNRFDSEAAVSRIGSRESRPLVYEGAGDDSTARGTRATIR
jgi:glycosyltransferase involved in cell wall biosynthesis